MKKALSFALALIMIFGVTASESFAFADETGEIVSEQNADEMKPCGKDAYYAFDAETGTLTVSGNGDIYDYNYSKKVSPFTNDKSIKKVVVEKGITSIGKHAFEGCVKLKSVSLPSGLKAIDKYAFAQCKGLTAVKLPDSVKTVGEGAFSECVKLKKITFGKKTKTVGKNAFFGCTKLKTVKFNNNLKTIAAFAFFNCKNVTEITVPKTVKTVGNGALGMYGKTSGKKYKLYKNKKFVIISKSAAVKDYAKANGFKIKNK